MYIYMMEYVYSKPRVHVRSLCLARFRFQSACAARADTLSAFCLLYHIHSLSLRKYACAFYVCIFYIICICHTTSYTRDMCVCVTHIVSAHKPCGGHEDVDATWIGERLSHARTAYARAYLCKRDMCLARRWLRCAQNRGNIYICTCSLRLYRTKHMQHTHHKLSFHVSSVRRGVVKLCCGGGQRECVSYTRIWWI